MAKPKLTEAGFKTAAEVLNCEVAAIQAVCEVEAPRGGFLPDDRVRILFERHKFHSFTAGTFSKSNPDISNRVAGGYGAEGAHQWARFSKAFALDPKAAMKSCSWGKFQIMGFNFAAAGFETLDDFVSAMKVSEDEQLKAFVNVIKSWALQDELRRHDWASFARQYNGENYKINRYDVKLAAAYKKYSGTPARPPARADSRVSDIGHSVVDDIKSEVATATEQTNETTDHVAMPADGAKPGEPAPVEAATAGQAIVGGRPGDPSKKVTTGGLISRVGAGILVLIFRQLILDWARLQLGASPDKYNVK